MSDVDTILQRVEQARSAGNEAGAARLLEDAVRAGSPEPRLFNAAGMQALRVGDFATAYERFSAAAERDRGQPTLWMNVATAARALGRDEDERGALQRAIAIDQRHLMAQLRLAELEERLGELAAAGRRWTNVLALADGLDNLPPALFERLDEARAFVMGQRDRLASQLDEALAGPMAGLPDSATRRVQGAIDHDLGRRAIFTNHCSGLHVPFLPADEYFDRAFFPWMEALEAKTDLIRAELVNLLENGRDAIRPYVRQDEGTPPNKWSALDGSLDWGACFLWEYGRRNDPVCDLCPETAAALDALPRNHIPGRGPSAFFSMLKPRTRIPPHTGVTNSRAIIHLPLIVPAGCWFRVGAEVRPWEEGKAFAFDDTIEHEAMNDSDELRAILIFDVWNPHLTPTECDLICAYYAAADQSDLARGRG